MEGSFFAGVKYQVNDSLDLKIQYDYVKFEDYSIDYVTTGIGLTW